jgi:hypothetical protein
LVLANNQYAAPPSKAAANNQSGKERLKKMCKPSFNRTSLALSELSSEVEAVFRVLFAMSIDFRAFFKILSTDTRALYPLFECGFITEFSLKKDFGLATGELAILNRVCYK